MTFRTTVSRQLCCACRVIMLLYLPVLQYVRLLPVPVHFPLYKSPHTHIPRGSHCAPPRHCCLIHACLQKAELKLKNQQVSFEEQKAVFKGQLAQMVVAAAHQRTIFDAVIAKAALDAAAMKEAYERLACDSADQKMAAAVVAAQVNNMQDGS